MRRRRQSNIDLSLDNHNFIVNGAKYTGIETSQGVIELAISIAFDLFDAFNKLLLILCIQTGFERCGILIHSSNEEQRSTIIF